jgi:hypothetical protein
VQGKVRSVVQVKKGLTGVRTPKRRNVVSGEAASTLDLVRVGVRRFILDEASIGDFHKIFRRAVRRGVLPPNPLTGAAFRRIVKEAIKERKRKTDGSSSERERIQPQ